MNNLCSAVLPLVEVFGFLRECFLRWLESLSLIGELSSGLLSIRKILHAAPLRYVVHAVLLSGY